MASINKARISGTDYDMSPSPTGVLDTTSDVKFISNDAEQSSADSYTLVDKINATETNSSIFGKITSMIKNARYLYNRIGSIDISEIGNSVTDAIYKLNSKLGEKASAQHSHSVSDLPVSNQHIQSNDYIPTSELVYSMNETLSQMYNGNVSMPVSYETVAPTEDNTVGLKFVVLSSEPETKYNGWVYFIVE